MRKALLIVVPAGLVLVLVVGVGLTGMSWLSGLTLPFQSTTVDRSQPALLTSIENLAELRTAVGNFEVVLDTQDDVGYVPDFIAGERSLFVAAGTVEAYVDLSAISETDGIVLSEDGTSATITLPPAQLGEPNLDSDRSYLFSQDRGVLDRLGDAFASSDQSDLYALAEEKLSAAAQESGLQQQADDNAQKILAGICESFGVSVTFVETTAGD